MLRIVHAIDRLNTLVGKLFAWTILAMIAIILYEVFMRYVMRSPTAWAYDAGYMLYGTIFIMAGAYALSVAAHVRGDVIYRLFSPRKQAGIDLVLYFIFFFPAVIALIYAGYGYAESSWRIGERAASGPGAPPVYWFKSLIPLAAAFLFLQGLAELMRCVMCLRDGDWPPRLSDVREVDVGRAQEILEEPETEPGSKPR